MTNEQHFVYLLKREDGTLVGQSGRGNAQLLRTARHYPNKSTAEAARCPSKVYVAPGQDVTKWTVHQVRVTMQLGDR